MKNIVRRSSRSRISSRGTMRRFVYSYASNATRSTHRGQDGTGRVWNQDRDRGVRVPLSTTGFIRVMGEPCLPCGEPALTLQKRPLSRPREEHCPCQSRVCTGEPVHDEAKAAPRWGVVFPGSLRARTRRKQAASCRYRTILSLSRASAGLQTRWFKPSLGLAGHRSMRPGTNLGTAFLNVR